MNQMMQNMADRMALTIVVARLSVEKYKNRRECPFWSELKGMEMALKTMGVPFEYDYDDDTQIVAVAVDGCRAAVKPADHYVGF